MPVDRRCVYAVAPAVGAFFVISNETKNMPKNLTLQSILGYSQCTIFTFHKKGFTSAPVVWTILWIGAKTGMMDETGWGGVYGNGHIGDCHL